MSAARSTRNRLMTHARPMPSAGHWTTSARRGEEVDRGQEQQDQRPDDQELERAEGLVTLLQSTRGHQHQTSTGRRSFGYTPRMPRAVSSARAGAVALLIGMAAAVAVPAGVGGEQAAPGPDPGLLRGVRWRNIGPHRASRTKALDGVPSQPHTFYMGVVNGGVWKTTDAGRTWRPIFDDQPTGSIGALAVAPSDPRIVYVGTGEAQQRPDLATGDGIYKSTDGGRTWTHLGLRDTQQITQVAVDPTNPERLFVAALGHPYGASAERGIFRSVDGGRTFERVLYRDEHTGGVRRAHRPLLARCRLRRAVAGAAGAVGERRLPR